MTVSRVTQSTTEVVSTQVNATARVSQVAVDVVSRTNATARVTQLAVDVVSPNVDNSTPAPATPAESGLLIICT